MTRMNNVSVFGANEQSDLEVDLLPLVRLTEHVLRAERVRGPAEMSLILVDESTIATLNEQYLDGNGPTDVLAFPIDIEALAAGRTPDHGGSGPGASSDEAGPPTVIGDVLICPTIAKRQAEQRGEPLEAELQLLTVHGTLHLLNYDHAEPDEAATMEARQQELLASFRLEQQ